MESAAREGKSTLALLELGRWCRLQGAEWLGGDKAVTLGLPERRCRIGVGGCDVVGGLARRGPPSLLAIGSDDLFGHLR